VIVGGDGNDRIHGQDGDDLLEGQAFPVYYQWIHIQMVRLDRQQAPTDQDSYATTTPALKTFLTELPPNS
jgi:hypothetical protein